MSGSLSAWQATPRGGVDGLRSSVLTDRHRGRSWLLCPVSRSGGGGDPIVCANTAICGFACGVRFSGGVFDGFLESHLSASFHG